MEHIMLKDLVHVDPRLLIDLLCGSKCGWTAKDIST